jgi:hypothetical protein
MLCHNERLDWLECERFHEEMDMTGGSIHIVSECRDLILIFGVEIGVRFNLDIGSVVWWMDRDSKFWAPLQVKVENRLFP